MLFQGETVYDDSNMASLMGDGTKVFAGGEDRWLSRLPPPMGADLNAFSTPFEAAFTQFPESEWDDRLDEQLKNEARVSDYQNFAPYDQDGLPTCWANGPAAALSTMLVMMGFPYRQVSACSVAVPISGGHRGGWEGDALDYLAKNGGVSVDLWPNNSTDRRLMNDSACQADRANHKALEWINLGRDFRNYMTAALMGWPMAVAYNDWSHVVMLCDGVRLDTSAKYGLRIRNNWGDWGAKNKFGYYGYAVFARNARQHGCPSSGFALRQGLPTVA